MGDNATLTPFYKTSKDHLLLLVMEMIGANMPEYQCSFCLCRQKHYQRTFPSGHTLATCSECGTVNIVNETEDAPT